MSQQPPMTLPLENPAAADDRSRFSWGAILGTLGPLISLVFVYLLFTLLTWLKPNSDPFATFDNFQLMLRQTSVVGIAAIGMTLIIISGGIDLSVGSNIALST